MTKSAWLWTAFSVALVGGLAGSWTLQSAGKERPTAIALGSVPQRGDGAPSTHVPKQASRGQEGAGVPPGLAPAPAAPLPEREGPSFPVAAEQARPDAGPGLAKTGVPPLSLMNNENCPADGGLARDCIRCASDADCPRGSGCGVDVFGGTSCLSSTCKTDSDCKTGESCRQVGIPGQSSPVWQCRLGSAGKGDACSHDPSAANGCGRGLICGPENRCVSSCDPARAGGQCSGKEKCVESPFGGGACIAVCELEQDCLDGMTCVKLGSHGAYCRMPTGLEENCTLSPCEKGKACQVSMSSTSVAFSCDKCCNPLDATSCGPGLVCGRSRSLDCSSTCYRPCTQAPDCQSGEACVSINEDLTLMGCVPRPK